MLLALAGGLAWMGPGQCLSITPVERIKRLALLAPATAFFQAPQALDRVTTPILAFAGMKDTITPPAQAEFLKHALGSHSPIDVRIIEDAGHFSFMNKPPPATEESLPNREAFLVGLTAELCRFVTC